MKFRHEWKHEISPHAYIALRARLSAVLQYDAHAQNGKYEIRSLYFDNPQNKALREKLDGVSRREKFRIRYYNQDPSFIILEKKSKIGTLCQKVGERLSLDEARIIAMGNILQTHKPLLRELQYKIQHNGLEPKTIVDYTREPFVYPPGNVRLTLDYNIRTSLTCTDFLNPDCVTLPVCENIILEVKWDEFLPELIRDLVQIPTAHSAPFSKYATCRIYG